MVEGAGLENRSRASDRGFESHPLRQLPVAQQFFNYDKSMMPTHYLGGIRPGGPEGGIPLSWGDRSAAEARGGSLAAEGMHEGDISPSWGYRPSRLGRPRGGAPGKAGGFAPCVAGPLVGVAPNWRHDVEYPPPPPIGSCPTIFEFRQKDGASSVSGVGLEPGVLKGVFPS